MDYIDTIRVENSGSQTWVTVTRTGDGLTVQHSVSAGSPPRMDAALAAFDQHAENIATAHATALGRVVADWNALTGE